jgi:general secretion pathway protein M
LTALLRKGTHCFWRFIAALLLLLLLILAVALPWQERHAFYQDRIEEHTAKLRRYHALIATLPILEHRLAALRSDKNVDAYYITATDSASGGIALQRRIEDIVRALGFSLSSVQVLPPEDQPFATRMGVRLRFGCSVDALWRLLYDIESSTPLLVIPALTVFSFFFFFFFFFFFLAPDMTPDLNVNMDVYGYIRRVSKL